VRLHRASAAVGALVAWLVLAPAAFARPAQAAEPAPPPRLLWATVNVCNSMGHPDAVGIRGSMPGTGVRGQRMFMRFQLQWLHNSNWTSVGPTADSGFEYVGSARARARQAGYTFTVTPPRKGLYTLRGIVTFQWREAGVVVRHARRTTSAAHPNTIGSDPAGFSTDICVIG